MPVEAQMQLIGEAKGKKFYFADNHFTHPGIYYWDEAAKTHVNADELLTSLDACHEVFENEAPIEYWDTLYYLAIPSVTKHSSVGAKARRIGLATGRERCESWLRFKGLWKD